MAPAPQSHGRVLYPTQGVAVIRRALLVLVLFLGVCARAEASSWRSANSTCYHEGSVTAAGTAPFVGEVAMNSLPLGARIELDRRVFGRRRFTVLDRIGWGSELDVYGPSVGACDVFGRRTLRYRVLRW